MKTCVICKKLRADNYTFDEDIFDIKVTVCYGCRDDIGARKELMRRIMEEVNDE